MVFPMFTDFWGYGNMGGGGGGPHRGWGHHGRGFGAPPCGFQYRGGRRGCGPRSGPGGPGWNFSDSMLTDFEQFLTFLREMSGVETPTAPAQEPQPPTTSGRDGDGEEEAEEGAEAVPGREDEMEQFLAFLRGHPNIFQSMDQFMTFLRRMNQGGGGRRGRRCQRDAADKPAEPKPSTSSAEAGTSSGGEQRGQEEQQQQPNFFSYVDHFLRNVCGAESGTGETCTRFGSQISRRDGQQQFQVSVDVTGFQPEEIEVKVQDGTIIISGSHEERKDGEGSVSRSFIRKYSVPEGTQLDFISSRMTPGGMLTVLAPKTTEVEIPVEVLGRGTEKEGEEGATGGIDKEDKKEEK